MCNAYNHPIGCKCGWGGSGHHGSSRGCLPSPRPISLAPRYRQVIGYTNPNAACPVCNAHVFFYQSPNGGRVFFDELGPPWPKHPCTDQGGKGEQSAANGSFTVIESKPQNRPRTPQWTKEGWVPFITDEIVRVPPPLAHSIIRGQINGQHRTLFSADASFPREGLIQARNTGIGRFELSVMHEQSRGKGMTVTHYIAFESPSHLTQKNDINAPTPLTTKPHDTNEPRKGTNPPRLRKIKTNERTVTSSIASPDKTPESPKHTVTLRRLEKKQVLTASRTGGNRAIQVEVRKQRTVKITDK